MNDTTFPHKAHETRNFTKRTALCEAQNWRCCYCGIRFSDDVDSDACATIEHVVPIVAGGLMRWLNEVVACRLCNEGRGAMYARSYYQHVVWKGRAKAAKWGRRRRQKRMAAQRAHVDRRTADAATLHIGAD